MQFTRSDKHIQICNTWSRLDSSGLEICLWSFKRLKLNWFFGLVWEDIDSSVSSMNVTASMVYIAHIDRKHKYKGGRMWYINNIIIINHWTSGVHALSFAILNAKSTFERYQLSQC